MNFFQKNSAFGPLLKILPLAGLLWAPPPAKAGQREEVMMIETAPPSPFDAGTREAGFSAGFLFSPINGTADTRPVINYAQQDLFFGWMLNTPGRPGWLRGNFEFLLNAFGTEITHGPGSYLVGGRLLFRYNFVQPGARLVPYLQVGGGGLANDVYRDQKQRVIGSQFEFTLIGSLGVRYFVSPRWALTLSADYEHVSNAGTASRNRGLNAAGGSIGVTTFF